MNPTSEILERIYNSSKDHPDGVFTRLYRYLLREDIYFMAYQKLYANKGSVTKGTDNKMVPIERTELRQFFTLVRRFFDSGQS